ncbi:MAG: cystathionine gamma-lyase [Anaerolineae bacterium]
MRDGTRVLRAGIPNPEQGAPFTPPITFASTYHAAGDPSGITYTYGRFGNPTWSHFEAALSELEGGSALAFASGMAAVAAVFGAVLRPGDVVVLPSDSYYTMRNVANGFFAEMGVQVRLAPTANNAQLAAIEGAKLLWLETPSNPRLDVCDIAYMCEQAHAAGALVAVDNTTACPLIQQPLMLGADFVVAADTKALCGHSDLLMGHVAVGDAAWFDRIKLWRTQVGAIPGTMEAWLAHRSLATLDVRLSRQCESAQQIAEYLSKQPQVINVRYPGLEHDPAYPIAKKHMRRFGQIISFELANKAQAENFLSGAKLIYEATSFGGVHTSAERRARWGGDDVSDGFIRLSVGCEDVADLLEDIEQALRHI